MFGRMKDPVEGTATIVSCSAFTEPGLENNDRPGFEVTLEAQVVVVAEGLEPTAVHWVTNFPQSQLPLVEGQTLPVVVDRRNPKRLKLAPGFKEQAKAGAKRALDDAADADRRRAEELAARMRAAE